MLEISVRQLSWWIAIPYISFEDGTKIKLPDEI